MAKGDAKPKPTGRKRPAEKDEKSQSERFIEAARLVGADESGTEFEKSFSLVSPPKRKAEAS